jgi:hypothetical protein
MVERTGDRIWIDRWLWQVTSSNWQRRQAQGAAATPSCIRVYYHSM